MNPYKFYCIVRLSDFRTWKQNHPTAFQTWRPRLLRSFDLENGRKSINGNYMIIENRLSYFNSRQRIIGFENLISNLTWFEMFPLELTQAWINAGYAQSIFDVFNQYPNLWNPTI